MCAFVCSDINYIVKSDLDHENEVLLVDICLSKRRQELLGVCYRPPNHITFYDCLQGLHNKCGGTEREYVPLGDFNTDVADVSSYNPYTNFYKSSGLTQMIAEPMSHVPNYYRSHSTV